MARPTALKKGAATVEPVGPASNASAHEGNEILVGRSEGLRALLALLVLLAAAYGNVLFQGRSLVYTNNYNPLDYRAQAENYGPEFVPLSTWVGRGLSQVVNFHDPGGVWWQWEPSGVYLHNGLLERDWPFWDPYVGAGVPAMANLTPAFFFPPYFLTVALGNTVLLKNAYFLAMLAVAGWFTYLVLRKCRVSPLASYAGGAAFMLSGGLAQNAGSFIGQTACCAPLAVWVTQRFVAKPSWRRGSVLSSVYAGIALASFPPLLLAIFGFSSLLVVLEAGVAALRSSSEARRLVARFAASAALAVGLVAFYYLPALAAMRSVPQIKSVYAHAGQETLSPFSFWQLLGPALVGGGEIYSAPSVRQPSTGKIPYLGATALLLALVGLASLKWRRLDTLPAAAAVAGLLIVLKLVGLPPVQWVSRVPGLTTIHFAIYFGIFLGFLLSLLTAFGLDALLTGTTSRIRAVGAIGVGFLFVLTLRTVIHLFEVPGVRSTWENQWQLVLLVTGLSGALAILSTLGKPRWRRSLGAALLLVLAVVGVLNTRYPRQKSFDVWRNPPPYVVKLAELAEGNRVFLAGALTGNASSAFDIFGLESLMTFNPPRVFELYKRYAAPASYLFLREPSQLPPDGVLDRANIAVVATREAFPHIVRQAEALGFETRWTDGFMRLLSRRSSPRYYFSSEYRVLPPAAALEVVGTLPRGREVVLESTPSFPSVPTAASDPLVRVRRFRRGTVHLEVEAPRPGLVYCSESHFPGWRAKVNGRPTPIVAANFAFRAVEVPAGHVVVELTYVPPGLMLGLSVSAISAFVLIGLSRHRSGATPPYRVFANGGSQAPNATITSQ